MVEQIQKHIRIEQQHQEQFKTKLKQQDTNKKKSYSRLLMETTLKNISKINNGPRNFRSKINDNKMPSDESMQFTNDYKFYQLLTYNHY